MGKQVPVGATWSGMSKGNKYHSSVPIKIWLDERRGELEIWKWQIQNSTLPINQNWGTSYANCRSQLRNLGIDCEMKRVN